MRLEGPPEQARTLPSANTLHSAAKRFAKAPTFFCVKTTENHRGKKARLGVEADAVALKGVVKRLAKSRFCTVQSSASLRAPVFRESARRLSLAVLCAARNLQFGSSELRRREITRRARLTNQRARSCELLRSQGAAALPEMASNVCQRACDLSRSSIHLFA